jgi:radical SAM enzyme (TIGR01210 family)
MRSESSYPNLKRERDRWILERRGARRTVNPMEPHGFIWEEERSENGQIDPVATIFLTNRECPWRCVMCDLWKTTVTESVPLAAIPAQIDYAFEKLGVSSLATAGASLRSEKLGQILPQEIKLYNGGSFFDPKAIPLADYPAIAERVCSFKRVIVECHPAFVRDSCVRFRDLLAEKWSRTACSTGIAPRLEVAMGLETAHPGVIERLNKGMTLTQFARAAEFLKRHDICLRVFVLIKPPFLEEGEALTWANKSIEFAFDSGATVVSLIPTRAGNGAMEALQEQGLFSPPKLATVEAAQEFGVNLRRGRVFADLWDLEKFSSCAACFSGRRERLRLINLEQHVRPPVVCADCSASALDCLR